MADGFTAITGNIKGFFVDLGNGISNGFTTITSAIKGFFEDLLSGILEGLKTLFIPTGSPFDEIKETFTAKLPVIQDVTLAVNSTLAMFNETKEPTFSLNFNGQYGIHGDVATINLKPYEPYRGTVKLIITAFVWITTSIYVIKSIPRIMGGVAYDSAAK